jgi:short-subunit dehydrogenase
MILQASKAAVSQFFETLRVELGTSVPITVFLPGAIKSEVGSSTSPLDHSSGAFLESSAR